MNFRDTTDSTEKILELIRKNNDNNNFLKSNSQHYVKKKSFSLKHIFFRKKYTIGFDFRKKSVRIVKLDLVSEQKHRLVLCKTIPFNLNDPDNEKQITDLQSIVKYEYNASNVTIWATIPKGKAEIRYFRVPKVPKKQLLKSIYWTFKTITSIEESKYIFDFEILGEVKEKDVIKKEIAAYAVLEQDIDVIKSIFSKIGCPVTGISIHPLALQNLIKYQYINTDNKNICCLYIGMEWSRIDIFSPNGSLVFSRRIRACTNSMIDEIAKNINQIKLTLDIPDKNFNIKNKNSDFITSDHAHKIFFSLISNAQDLDSNLKEILLDINSKDIFGMFTPALKRLVWQVERSIESFQSNTEETHIGKIYVSGEIADYKPIIDYIGRNLEHQIEAIDFDPFSSDILNSDNMLLPESHAEKSGYVPAFGIALSRNFFTPNFMFTYKEKSLFLNSKRVNYSFFLFFFLFFFLTLSGFWAQQHIIKKKQAEIAELQNKYNKIILENNINIHNELIDEQISKIQEKRKTVKLYAKRNFVIAVLRDITNLSPPNIGLLSISLYSVPKTINKTKEDNKTKINVDVKGLVQGNPVFFETSLNSYIENLKLKPYFLKSTIKQKENQVLIDEPVLKFYINLELKIDD